MYWGSKYCDECANKKECSEKFINKYHNIIGKKPNCIIMENVLEKLFKEEYNKADINKFINNAQLYSKE